MKVTIQGLDYTTALDAAKPLSISRKLNEPSICQLWLSLPCDGNLPQPSRNQFLTITGDDGTIYFTGYLAVTPVLGFAGFGTSGPLYHTTIQAVSDDILLDQVLMPPSRGMSGETAGALLSRMVTRTGSSALSTQGTNLDAAISDFVPEPGAPWSRSAGQIAGLARAAYRVLNGAMTLTSVQTIVHPLDESDGSLSLDCLTMTATAKRALANDVTVCGEIEPLAYATEYFQGDGVTTEFYLTAKPYFPPSSRSTLIQELFNEGQIDLRMWGAGGSTNYFSLGASGLGMNGGNGIDGQTQLCWLDPIEMGGTLLLEAAGVTLAPGSTGILAALYSGVPTVSGCSVGFQAIAQQGTGEVSLQPIVMGSPAGTAIALSPANQYTLRVRIGCPEQERELAIYRSFGDDGQILSGGHLILSPGRVQIEVQEYVNGVGATPVTLYDGSINNLPATCTIVAASSINLIGTMRALNLTSLGSGWVVSTPANGQSYSRRPGPVTEAGDCYLERTGRLVFYNGFAPAVGERIAVNYRTTPARSSADCRNAALALEQAAAGVSALWCGSYKGTRASFASDVWPGDALELNVPSANLNAQVVVRAVKITYTASYPDLVEYSIDFANDWAEDLAIRTSETVPEDAWLPAPVAPTVLTNLNNLTVTSLTGTTVTINTGVTPPAGGGFEIRRRDFAFMPGEDPGLVARATLPNITFSRETANDRFFVRMYDNSTPPNYSEFSTSLFINLPLGG